MAMTGAERARAFRARKRAQALINGNNEPPRSSAQRVREFRARQKALKMGASVHNLGSTAESATVHAFKGFAVPSTSKNPEQSVVYRNFNINKTAHQGVPHHIVYIDGERSASTVLQDVAVKEEYIDEENTLGSYDFDDPEFIADDPLEVSEDAGGCNTDTSLNLPQSDKKHTSKIDMGVINEAILRLDRVTANDQKSNGGLDDFEAFGRYVVTSLRRMRPERAVEAQREMREIVENAMKDIAFRDDDAVLETDAEHCMENDIPTVTSTPGQTNINEEEMLTGNDLEQITRAAVTKRKSNDDSNPVEETDDNNDVHLSTQDSDQYTISKKQKLTRSEMMSHVMDKVDYMMGRVTSETERPDDAELLGRYISESLRKMPLHMALCVENDLYSVIVKYRLECTKKDSKISNPP